MNRNIVRRSKQVVSVQIIQGLLLFISSWSIDWIWAWIFVLLGIILLVINFFLLPSELIEERGKVKENVKKWDTILTTINIFPILGIYIISGFDYRFGWSGNLNIFVQISSLFIYLLGSMLFTWSMVSNKYFSTMVRIQVERDHEVATRGPYKFIRHPGYFGFIITILATPVLLGSIYGLILSGFSTAILIIRTGLEDKTLKKELEGYMEYSTRVKYKLLPFIW